MKLTYRAAFAAVLAISLHVASAATFNYHGTLQDGGKPANGKYDLQLTLYSAAEGGKVVAGPLTLLAVPVYNGNFNTQADLATNGYANDVWLAVAVRDAGSGEFASLPGRAAVSANASNVCPGAWTLQGNAGNPAGSFLGTTDANDPLTFMVGSSSGGVQAGQITASGDGYPTPNVVFGSSTNSVSPTIGGATIAGGGSSIAICGLTNGPCANSVNGDFATIGGGEGNMASNSAATVSGGNSNTASGGFATVSGGFFNFATDFASSVGGGQVNSASASSASIMGGFGNFATGVSSSVAGGYSNSAGGDFSFAAGDGATVRTASQAGNSSTCASGSNCGDYGTFVWEDASTQGTNFTSAGPNEFLIQATGGVGINTNAVPNRSFTIQGHTQNTAATNSGTLVLIPDPGQGSFDSNIHHGINGDWYIRSASGAGKVVLQDLGGVVGIGTETINAGDLITTGANGAHLTMGGVWTNGSSRAFKEAFSDVDAGSVLEKVLALPIQTWFYKVDHAEGRHMGPMAEDFSQAFGLGSDDKHIGSVDESGVAFAAIKGLNEKLEKENSVLRGKLDDLTARLSKLEAGKGE